MRPQDALSPRNRIATGSLNVVYTAPDGSWSLAEMLWDGDPAIGLRWNGDINDPNDKGNPRSHSQGTWFILPDVIGSPLAALAKGLQNDRATARPEKRHPRAGWAETSAEIEELAEEDRAWLDFGNTGDDQLQW